MQSLLTLNPENVSDSLASSFKTNEAGRAVVFDDHDNIALLHVTRYNYYKLPGGGIDEGEETLAALKRECIEEIGCEIEVLAEVGMITELRKMYGLNQISYCYTAKLVGEKGEPQFTQSEMNDGFKVLWVPFSEALALVNDAKTNKFSVIAYTIPREVAILKQVQQMQSR